MCQSLGGALSVPQNQTDYEAIIQSLEVRQADMLKNDCSGTMWLGIRKIYTEDTLEFVDINGTEGPFMSLKENQPNGRNFEECVQLSQISKVFNYYDTDCNRKLCPLCKIDMSTTVVTLRGQVPPGLLINRKYGIEGDRGLSRLVGFTSTRIIKQKDMWYILDLFVQQNDRTLGYMREKGNHLLGLTSWNISNELYELKFTQCNREKEFTCHRYGDCLPMVRRCDGRYDCLGDKDKSDEEDCDIVNIEKGSYAKERPPKPLGTGYEF